MATVTLDAFLAGVAQLGTVHTGDGGFEQALGAALLDSGKLKNWATPATAQQSGAAGVLPAGDFGPLSTEGPAAQSLRPILPLGDESAKGALKS